MSKKRVTSTGGARKPHGDRSAPASQAPGAKATAGRRGGSASRARRKGGGRSEARRPRQQATSVVTWAAIVTAAALLAVSAMAYAPGLVGPYFIPRAALSYPLVGLFAALAFIACRPGLRPFTMDLVDVLALTFATWVLLGAALSPAPAPAWFGYYNRGTGAFFWVAVVVLFLVARRLLAGRLAERALAVSASALLVLTASVALAQAGGADTWWGAAGVVDGRVTGTTGNPVTLAGLCLLGVWLAGLALGPGRSLWIRVVTGAGAAAGAVCLVLSVSRAAYLGVLAAAIVVVVAWVRRREWRRLAALGAVGIVALAGAATYAPSDEGAASLFGRLQDWRVEGSLNESDAKRMDLWGEAVKAAADRPVTGLGAGAFVVADRLYRPAERRIRTPWALASDPHSLPLLVLSTTGVVGLALGVATVVVALLITRRRPRRRSGDADGDSVDADAAEGEADAESRPPGWDRLPGLAYVAAALVFLLVSPLDKVVAFPVVLVGGGLLGTPRPGVWARTVPAAPGAWGRVAWGAALAVTGMLILATSVAGARFWRADKAFADAARVDAAAQYARAADLFTWEVFYTLEAGGKVWREGLAEGEDAAVDRGRALIDRGIDRDPTGAMGYADLARLAIARGDAEEAVRQARLGLRWNPDHPVLQALWGYAALVAVSQLKDRALGARLAADLEELPASTPDAWYWLSEVRRATGDAAGAAQARARAKELGPKLTAHRFEQRLLAR